MAKILLHFEGDITKHNHSISLRTLGTSLTHLQAAINRAHLDVKYGEVWKNARLKHEDYEDTELWTNPPQEGGYIIDFVNDSPKLKRTLKRVVDAVTPAIEKSKSKALATAGSLAQQSDLRKEQISKGIIEPTELEDYIPTASQLPYGDRAINKEIDLLAGVIRTPNAGRSTIELFIDGEKSSIFRFNRIQSENFHSFISKRSLGDPLVFSANVLELDAKNKSARIHNLVTGKDIKMAFAGDDSFEKIKPFLGIKTPMRFYGSPIYEGGTYDFRGGDVFFIGLA